MDSHQTKHEFLYSLEYPDPWEETCCLSLEHGLPSSLMPLPAFKGRNLQKLLL